MRLCSFKRDGEQVGVFVAKEPRTLRGRKWDLEGRSTVPARRLDSRDETDFLCDRFKVPAGSCGLVRSILGSTLNMPIAN